ncbi:MAG: alpha-amylase [Chitinophagaceae bacterium]|nr:MAG: alpha-amylase [Chitinophagaceae bacterium]
MKRLVLSAFAVVLVLGLRAQDLYPTHWFTGFKNPVVQLIIHDTAIGTKEQVKTSYPGVTVKKVHTVSNPNYLFVDLLLSPSVKPGTVKFTVGTAASSRTISWKLVAKNKEDGISRIKGVRQEDFIYLLMPDRFANGDPSNDAYTDMLDKEADRNNPFARHGGDLLGIENNLDYLKELGITTIWPTPILENDMSRTSEGGTSRSTYHGYAFTDHYKVDKRFGGNEAYKQLVDATHRKGMKFMQDAVYNHVGTDHWFIRDQPSADWVNVWPSYTNTSHKHQVLADPYSSAADRKLATDGWFTPFMADLNQRNPFVANFLIQYAIWATEEFGIDGWRVDTWFYSDAAFLNRINDAMLKEFPKLTIFGEAWVQSTFNSAYFTQNNLDVPFKHNVQGVTDFPLYGAMLDGLNQPFGWSEGVTKLYATLSQDALYKDPTRNSIFLDNHDLDRVYSVIGEDFSKYKMAINWLLTLRGIPQLYYGTEILMKNFKNPTDAEVRRDFPGGWKGDPENKFTKQGRTSAEEEAFEYVSSLARFRKASTAIGHGKLMQYVPENGLYVYFRYDSKQTVMVISNTGSSAVKPDWKRFSERMDGFRSARDAQSGKTISLEGWEIKPKESFVFELIR